MTAMLSAAGLAAGCAQPKAAPTAPARVTLDHIRAPQVALPARSCDCHVHIFDPSRFPYVSERTYTPASAKVADLLAFERRLGIERFVLVQPSGYGTDNRCLVDALGQLGRERARGVAVVDVQRVTAQQIESLHAAGVRSIRLNLEVKGEHSAARTKAVIQEALQVVSAPGWSIQIYADLTLVNEVADVLAQARTPVVLDHFGGLKADKGLDQAGFSTLVQLVRSGNTYVKLSAPYRASKMPDYGDVAPFARQLIEAAPNRMIWASDWPHTGSSGNRSGDLSRIEPFRLIDDGAMLDLLTSWAPAPELRQRILVDNPARLYDFSA